MLTQTRSHRPKQTSLSFEPIGYTLLHYYASRSPRATTMAHVIRHILRRFMDNDKSFNPDAFAKFVNEQLVPNEDDERIKNELASQAQFYADKRRTEG